MFQWRVVADEAAVAEEEEVEVLGALARSVRAVGHSRGLTHPSMAEEESDEVNLSEMGLLEAAKEAPDRGEAQDFAKLLEGGGYTGVGGGEDQLVTMVATDADEAIGGGEQFMAVKVRSEAPKLARAHTRARAQLALRWREYASLFACPVVPHAWAEAAHCGHTHPPSPPLTCASLQPWVGAVVAPSDEPEPDTSAPPVDLSLEVRWGTVTNWRHIELIQCQPPPAP